jgi:hypothetical protein
LGERRRYQKRSGINCGNVFDPEIPVNMVDLGLVYDCQLTKRPEGGKPEGFGGSFIEQYVFPDGDTPPLPIMLCAAESSGFEIRDVENLREHYALTLRHWLRRLEAHHNEALRFVDEETYRVWRLYVAGSAHGFRSGHIAVYQTLLAKLDPLGRTNLPLTRDDWYTQNRAEASSSSSSAL